MQKSLLPRQRIELLRLELDVKQAERAMLKVEMKHGNKSPIYAVAERQRDEIVARIQRLTGTLATAKNGSKSAGDRVATMLVKSKRNIARDF